ncbi:MAG TPA: MnhB domain-containing protein [Limnochordia bacterium]|nr:MnhB domain-containing protein [Limnochordia bacterium]
MSDIIVQVVTRMMIPYLQLYGLYIILYGHNSPGGGFAGGTIIASSLILYVLAFGLKNEELRLSSSVARVIESCGALAYVAIGLAGIVLGANFLSNNSAGFPLGIPGRIFSGGTIVLLTVAIGLKVASTMITLFTNIAEKEGEEE